MARIDDSGSGPGCALCRILYLMVLMLSSVAWSGARAEPPVEPVPMLQVSIGKVGIFDNVDDPYRIGLEYQFRPFDAWRLIPAIGAAAAQNDARFVYFDLRRNFWVSERWATMWSSGMLWSSRHGGTGSLA